MCQTVRNVGRVQRTYNSITIRCEYWLYTGVEKAAVGENETPSHDVKEHERQTSWPSKSGDSTNELQPTASRDNNDRIRSRGKSGDGIRKTGEQTFIAN